MRRDRVPTLLVNGFVATFRTDSHGREIQQRNLTRTSK